MSSVQIKLSLSSGLVATVELLSSIAQGQWSEMVLIETLQTSILQEESKTKKKPKHIYSCPTYNAEIYMDLYQLHLTHKHYTVPNPEISYIKELHII